MARTNKLKHKGNNKPINISQTLIIKPPQRSNVGIDKWRSAMRLADRGRRATLIELINELIDADPVFGEAWDKRVRRSEERRVGKECRAWWVRYYLKEKVASSECVVT